MNRCYSTPGAFKQALEHRLRAEAAGDGTELARLRQLLVFDRFLARVVSAFGKRAILKGGLVIELRLQRARTTKDIDLRLVGDPNDALERLQEAGRLEEGDFLRFEVRSDARRPEIEAKRMTYKGRRYHVRALLAGKIYGLPFSLDVAFAEPMVGEVEEVEGSGFLAFAGGKPVRFRIYPLEVHIAEKLHAYTMPRARPNSRVKDLPDIALLAMVRSLRATSLRKAIERTFRARRTHDIPTAVPLPPPTWVPVYERMARTDGLRWTTLEELGQAVTAFLDPVLAGGKRRDRWDPSTWTWGT